ncbi:ubiquinone biosynthesis protein COQ9 [Entomobacter blattae]|nr:TetR family transcriptional regulator [Entomobacter blattae]
MTMDSFQDALLQACMDCAAKTGWSRMTLAQAAKQAGYPIEQARQAFPSKAHILLSLNAQADQAALQQAQEDETTPREKLFDLLMSRFDVLQRYRPGIKALMYTLPFNPCLSLWSGAHIALSMKWMAEAAQIDTSGLKGHTFVKGLIAVWFYTLRIWAQDKTDDLSKTMAALDSALGRLVKFPFLILEKPPLSAKKSSS